MPWEERSMIVKNLCMVNRVIRFKDTDDTACDAIHKALSVGVEHIIFANGGDRTKGNTPEMDVCRKLDVTMLWNIGGGKIQSSSWLINGGKDE